MAGHKTSQQSTIFEARDLLDISREFAERRAERASIWYGFREGDGYWGAMPFVDSLYRGQTKRHIPMLPAIARGLEAKTGELCDRPANDQARIVLRLAQSWWFARELEFHPVASHAESQRLRLDRQALAQHYGVPTGYLDLSDDFDVAAFFATCEKDPSRGWVPAEEGVGIVYRVALKSLSNPFGEYRPLGPQPLPRPTEQCAWVTELPITDSFEGWPDVMMMQFRHDKSVGEHFKKKFDAGNALFPPDPLADVAAEITDCGEIPKVILEKALTSFVEDPAGIRASQLPEVECQLAGMAKKVRYRRLLTEEQVSSLIEEFDWRRRMLSDIRVRWRMIRDEPDLELL